MDTGSRYAATPNERLGYSPAMEAGALPEIERHGHFMLEIAIATVLGLTAIATAWSAYQAGRSERQTIEHYN